MLALAKGLFLQDAEKLARRSMDVLSETPNMQASSDEQEVAGSDKLPAARSRRCQRRVFHTYMDCSVPAAGGCRWLLFKLNARARACIA
jgi:hypothetical protein